MSSFSVEVVRLDDVVTHPNADLLELAQVGGFRAVVGKGIHKKGDLVVYIPQEAILPDSVSEALGYGGKLSGAAKNRVKAMRLRGELSEGLVIPFAKAVEVMAAYSQDPQVGEGETWPQRFVLIEGEGFWVEQRGTMYAMHAAEIALRRADDGGFVLLKSRETDPGLGVEGLIGLDVAKHFGITKYEPTIPAHMAGIARPRPSWFPIYESAENIKKYDRVLEPGEVVVMTEKIHGTNFGVGMTAEDRELLVSSRKLVLEFDENNLYWKAAMQHGLAEDLVFILGFTGAKHVVLWGEIYGYGVQHLHYGASAGETRFRAFDLQIEGVYADHDWFMEIMQAAKIETVPVLYRGPFTQEALDEHTNGVSTVGGSHTREGVVVKPIKERRQKMGRVTLKSVCSAYLTDKNRTDLN